MNNVRKRPRVSVYCIGLSYSVILREFAAVDDDNACTVPIMADKDIFEFVQSSKTTIHVDSDEEKETNNTVPVPTSSEMRNIT
ncbi:hypothetical protein TNCV_3420611 [Trichonephila clavipes]|nr:hypothetical protein TNCV_3420611 [Trichonephila clavipes]